MNEKENFSKKLEQFVTELKAHVSTKDGQWAVKGFVDVFKNGRFQEPSAKLAA